MKLVTVIFKGLCLKALVKFSLPVQGQLTIVCVYVTMAYTGMCIFTVLWDKHVFTKVV